MKLFLFLLPALLVVQHTNTCSNNMYTINAADVAVKNKSVTDSSIIAIVQQVLFYTNKERKKENLAPVVENEKLMTAAANYAELMASEGELSHTVNGQTLPMRYATVGYLWKYCGENIAASSVLNGQDVVVNEWMNSTGHRGNILNSNFTEIGIAIVYSSKLNRYYYCEDFGQPR